MANLYTKDGRPLTRRGDDIFSRSGRHVGRVRGSKVYGPDGRYAGTLVGDRVVYRSTDSASVGSPYVRGVSTAASAATDHAGSALWGSEPDFAD